MLDGEYATHLFSYRFGDARWTLEIKAKDAREAQERLRALAWATYDGELVATIPVVPRRLFRLFDWLQRAAPTH